MDSDATNDVGNRRGAVIVAQLAAMKETEQRIESSLRKVVSEFYCEGSIWWC